MSFPAVTPISYAPSSGSLNGPDGNVSFDDADDEAVNGSGSSTNTWTPPPAGDPLVEQYNALRRQEATLQGEVNALQHQYEQQVGSANASWSIAQTYRAQEESEKDDARENGEDAPKSVMSSVMSGVSREQREAAIKTAETLGAKQSELTALQGRMAQIKAEIDARPRPT